jgi:uncharacterized membrane protein (UPF0127 family)
VALYEKEEEVCRVCAVVADTPEKREVGLSGVSRLAKFDGMLFPLEESPGTSFWMKNVFFPIDVYFFDGNGSLISGNSMTTCLHSECALYPVPAEAAWALEVPSSVLGVTGTEFSVALVTSETCDGYLVAESVSRSPDR